VGVEEWVGKEGDGQGGGCLHHIWWVPLSVGWFFWNFRLF